MKMKTIKPVLDSDSLNLSQEEFITGKSSYGTNQSALLIYGKLRRIESRKRETINLNFILKFLRCSNNLMQKMTSITHDLLLQAVPVASSTPKGSPKREKKMEKYMKQLEGLVRRRRQVMNILQQNKLTQETLEDNLKWGRKPTLSQLGLTIEEIGTPELSEESESESNLWSDRARAREISGLTHHC